MYKASVDRPGLIWVASKTGIARSVNYVLSPADLAAKVALGRTNGWPGIAPDGSSISVNDEDGFQRPLGTVLPAPAPDASVLSIDASYFVNGTAAELLKQLDQAGTTYPFVTMNRATDATDVPDAARAQLDSLAATLRARGYK